MFCLTAAAAETPLDVSPEADLEDDIILKNTLYVSISAEDIYRSEFVLDLAEQQSKQMLAASKRRMARQEKRIEELRIQVEAGKVQPDELKAAVTEMNRRIETGYLALARSTILDDIIRSARAERDKAARRGGRRMERYDGGRPFTPSMLRGIEVAFRRQFGRGLPISAHGDTALHKALGLDHTGRVDVAVSPDEPEGMWLRKFLETMHIPYYAFRTAIPGSATAPHIHIGPGSLRYRPAMYRPPPSRRSATGG
jgi:hypothetical protein